MKKTGITDVKQYTQEWYDKMIDIWIDRIHYWGIRRTGSLESSINQGHINMDDLEGDLSFKFLEYGLYVDSGTGNGYKRGNGGDLPFLDKAYRYEHGMKRKRYERPWFSVSWAISCRILKNRIAMLIGDRFSGMFDNL